MLQMIAMKRKCSVIGIALRAVKIAQPVKMGAIAWLQNAKRE